MNESKRAFVFADLRSSRALVALDCKDLSGREAKVAGHVDLSSIKQGMVVRPAGEDGKPDMTKAYKVINVNQVKTGVSTIKFESGSAVTVKEPPSPSPPAPEK